jgi:hypothetical protein
MLEKKNLGKTKFEEKKFPPKIFWKKEKFREKNILKKKFLENISEIFWEKKQNGLRETNNTGTNNSTRDQ